MQVGMRSGVCACNQGCVRAGLCRRVGGFAHVLEQARTHTYVCVRTCVPIQVRMRSHARVCICACLRSSALNSAHLGECMHARARVCVRSRIFWASAGFFRMRYNKRITQSASTVPMPTAIMILRFVTREDTSAHLFLRSVQKNCLIKGLAVD